MTDLILASKSPRRRDLLKLLGHPFTSTVSAVAETARPGETPAEHVTRLSREKAADIGESLAQGIVIGSDTVVVLDGDILEKPSSPEDAVGMVMRLQGRTHTVYTGFALHNAATGEMMSDHKTTQVTMKPMDRELAERYVATGEPMDKAGAYGIQGYGAALITGIEGCYFTVMGLPLSKLAAALREFSRGEFDYFGNGGQQDNNPERSDIHETIT